MSSVGSTTSSTSATGMSIDVQALVNATLQAESGPITLMQQQQASLSAQASALSNIQNEMVTLQTSVNALADLNGQLGANTVSSSDTTVATATADSTASLTSHTLTVTQLAVTSSAYSDAVSGGSSATLNDGTLNFTVNGSSQSVAISAANGNNTLDTLATYINQQSGLGVSASVITDSTGARLVLNSSTSGAAGSITAISYTASGSGNTSLTFGTGTSNIVAGKDSLYSIDGVSLDSTSNNISGALQGVTLNLTGTGTTSLSITPDATQATSAINTFITAYNAVISSINSQFAYNSTTGSTGPLGSDSSLMMVQQSLLNDASYAISGNSGYTGLSSVGITTNEDGTLSLDSSAFTTALQSNPSAVRNLFQQFSPTNGVAQNFANDLTNLTDPTSGPLSIDQNSIAQNQSDLTSQISDFQANLALQRQQLILQYSQMNATMQEMPITLNQISQQMSQIG